MVDLIEDGMDLYLVNFERYLNATIARLRPRISDRVHLVWFSTYAYPSYMPQKNGNHINNHLIAAANTYIEMSLLDQGVEIFDVSFHASNIKQERAVCGYYYVCKLERLSYVHGVVGSQIMDAFTLYMCQPPETMNLNWDFNQGMDIFMALNFGKRPGPFPACTVNVQVASSLQKETMHNFH